ncbi:uncharacterized protein LOC113511548 [Galleria mellonella]|uniref:Uncharacterized protein LOC113511548 n=1 Tax=Galleria mellonella TaxID=7137 RepID=A0A6J1WBY2_GALME|nr:uncharacterized protein LOC113511548 [Galleria mellonella]
MIILRAISSLLLLISENVYAYNINTNRYLREINDDSASLFIPVAIISEENRQAKVIDSTVSKSINTNPSEKSSVDNKDHTIIKVTKDFTVKPINNDKEKHIGIDQPLKVDINTDLEIPVAVVYEEPITPNNIRKTTLRRKITNNEQSYNRRRINKATIAPSETTSDTNIYKQQNSTSEPHLEISQSTNEKLTTSMVFENNSIKKRTRERDPVVPIIQSENQVFSHNGVFHYSYEGGDGTKAFENGELKTYDDEKTGEAVVGGFSYTGKDGQDYSLTYTADENGYRPVGAHLPTPPPIPPAIERALRYLATKTTPETVTDPTE